MEGNVQNLGQSGLYNVGISNLYLNFAGKDNAKFDAVYDPFLADIKFDYTDFSYVNPEIEEKFNDVLNKQGIVGKVWDFAKNCLGNKMGSNAVSKKLELYKKGLISEEEIIDAVNKYAKGQQKALDFVADWGSTIIGAGAFAFAMPLCASVPIALTCAAVGGALFKTGAKRLDAYSAGRSYKTGPYDIATGAICGFLSPIVNGIGNAAVKAVGTRLGLRNLTNAGGKFAYNGFSGAIKHFALFPKQKLEGNMIKKLAAWGTGKTFRGIAKFGGAFALRQYVFTVFSQDAISKTIIKKNPLIAVFGQQEIIEQIEKQKGKDIDFSDNIYANCVMMPQQAEQMQMVNKNLQALV